jgi:hypothetical protein
MIRQLRRLLPVSLVQVVVGRRKRIQQFLFLIVILCFGCSIILNHLLYYSSSTSSTYKSNNAILSPALLLEQQQNNRTNGIIIMKQQYQRPTMAPQNSSRDTIGYIHIGKTGGSTISNRLRNGCNSFSSSSSSSGHTPCHPNIPNETIISKLVEYYYHGTLRYVTFIRFDCLRFLCFCYVSCRVVEFILFDFDFDSIAYSAIDELR